ncbi:MAG: (2Fe-2S)-binding protein [bacterium]|nr:(2Fe-2S)-binding protein [bacterium]
MSIEIKLKINGVEEQLSVSPKETLVNVLRDRLGLVGTHKDCEMGICGACTVLLEGCPVSSCLLLAVQANGSAITTIEGMERGGRLNRIQEAFLRHGAVQCGYCTPGFIMTATALLEKNPKPGRAEITEALRGNLCRCTGYTKIIDAVESVANS